MKAKVEKIPTISICNLLDSDYSLQDLIVYDLNVFLDQHTDIKFPHRHTFYQLLFITGGHGSHIIDFKKYDVKKGMLFFLSPNQVHEWKFDKNVKGILINFNELLLSSFLANRHYIRDFYFFTGNGERSAVDTSKDRQLNQEVSHLFHKIMAEFQSASDSNLDFIRVLILQLFLYVNKKISGSFSQTNNTHNYVMLHNFEKLLEQHYQIKRLPKEYAEMLYITPNYLNALCNQITGKSAGEIIRNRVLLEAKRLLVNSSLNISELAYELSFEDNSYFSKFFKKYEGVTPDEFRKLKS